MQLLHETPIFTRDAVRKSLGPTLPVQEENDLPADLLDLFKSELADQVELIKITPNFLTTDEMFKLWMAFQAPYRPTAAYQASVVLIESEGKGKIGHHRCAAGVVRALPFRAPGHRRGTVAARPNKPFVLAQPILPGYRLALIGRQLRGDATRVLIDGTEVPAAQVVVTDKQVDFPLPAGLLPGAHGRRWWHRST